ncbi:acetaldehyde dehydrogenase (acetylating) [Mycobacterium colombiense]|uniref:Acetaldehyde dehydrogenase n=1 Tax=Mycobacterium colombiense TaxID=339268 RepID=A0A1A2YHM7_9MYCO|nr:acetaldehyde dehydrogenase (acetylating) [Mycobacterium colombiense]OBI36963.1 acetaldehyde dehydrogenase (acetylating) [Mycobacterium colombiense]
MAIIGSGNIATDLMLKISQSDGPLAVGAMVGTDSDSDGLVCARRIGVPTTAEGIEGLLQMPDFADIKLAFDATSAAAHRAHWEAMRYNGIRMLDLTPASIGPFCVPAVNLDDHLDAPNLSMVTCGGQATVPIVAAVGKAGIVSYAETVSSIAAKSAGPGTRANIDEFIETTATALRVVGGAHRGKAVIILNPADPPVLMRNTVYCLVDGDCDHDRIDQEILGMVDRVAAYVPGYRLKRDVQFEIFDNEHPLHIPETGKFTGTRVTVMLEVAGTADNLPAHAGNLDIMTAAAKATAERIALNADETTGATT